MSTSSNRHALPVDLWPAQDRAAWEAACDPAFTLSGTPAAAKWRPSSRALHARNYGSWLGWLKWEGLLESGDGPDERMSRERFLAYLQYRQKLGNNAQTLLNHASTLRRMLLVLAPSRDWDWMKPIIVTLKSATRPSEKHSNLPSIRELFELGLVLMQQAETSDRPIWSRAIMFRNGLAVAMLAARPWMRRANISGIRIGEHLLREGAVYQLRFSGDEMKAGRPQSGSLPEILSKPIERYLHRYRPCLLHTGDGSEKALWISNEGRAIDPDGFSGQFGRVTKAAFGRTLRMHAFRHAAASSIAKEDPEHVGIVTTINGHASYSTDERYYIIAEEHAAFRRYHDALERLSSAL